MLRRMVDVLGSAMLLLLAAPVSIVVALMVRGDGGPALYRQTRAGLGGRPFELLKFRSMRVNNLPLQEGEIRSGHPLVTPIGQRIRRFKIDELPQLLNVLRGEMSLVGPRPTVPEQVAGYTAYERRRLKVRPGITGWAQVNGNIEHSWPDRIALDVWYVDHCSVWLDARILLRTLAVVLVGERLNSSALKEARTYANRVSRGS